MICHCYVGSVLNHILRRNYMFSSSTTRLGSLCCVVYSTSVWVFYPVVKVLVFFQLYSLPVRHCVCCAKCTTNEGSNWNPFSGRKQMRRDTEEIWRACAGAARYTLTFVRDRLKPRKRCKIPVAVQTERREGDGGRRWAPRASRKDLRLVNQPTPPHFRFIITKYSTPFLFNITFTL
jgi:hypothetical protein